MNNDDTADYKISSSKNWKPGLTTKALPLAKGIADRIESLGKLNDRYLQARNDNNAAELFEVADEYQRRRHFRRATEIRVLAGRLKVKE